MDSESVIWFGVQLALMGCVVVAGLRVARRPDRIWKTAAVGATVLMFAWPVMRFEPIFFLRLFGADALKHFEVTGICIPASLMFSIAIIQSPTPSMKRMVGLLIIIVGMYFFRFGGWMVKPPVANLGTTVINPNGVCMQSTNYTCVAASLVTLLKAWGIDASESEMARLSRTEREFGTTDIRALSGLNQKLEGTSLQARYASLDIDQLQEIPLPCVTSIDWGYSVSHMIAIMDVTDDEIVIGDPLNGMERMPRDLFLQKWHGCGIYLEQGK